MTESENTVLDDWTMETPSSGVATPVDVENGVGQIRKRLTVTFRELTVRVTAPDAALGRTLWSEIDPRQIVTWFTRKNPPKRVSPVSHSGPKPVLTRADYFEGCFRPGEARRNGMDFIVVFKPTAVANE